MREKIIHVNEETITAVDVPFDNLSKNSKRYLEELVKEFNQCLGAAVKNPDKFNENMETLKKYINEVRKKIIIQNAPRSSPSFFELKT